MAGGPPAHLTRHVVLLHGFTGSGASWHSGITEALEVAGTGWLAPDLPGHGAHSALDSSGPVSLDGALDVIDTAVAEATRRAGGGLPIVVGYSMGGRLALHYALRAPAAIGGLVLESASPGLDEMEARAARVESDRALAARIRLIGAERFAEEWGRLPLFSTQRGVSAALRARVNAVRRASDPEGLATALEELGTGALSSLWGELRRVAVPTLVLAGEADEKFVAIAQSMHECIPGSTLELVGGAGHRVHLEAPEDWMRAVLGFSAALAGRN